MSSSFRIQDQLKREAKEAKVEGTLSVYYYKGQSMSGSHFGHIALGLENKNGELYLGFGSGRSSANTQSDDQGIYRSHPLVIKFPIKFSDNERATQEVKQPAIHLVGKYQPPNYNILTNNCAHFGLSKVLAMINLSPQKESEYKKMLAASKPLTPRTLAKNLLTYKFELMEKARKDILSKNENIPQSRLEDKMESFRALLSNWAEYLEFIQEVHKVKEQKRVPGRHVQAEDKSLISKIHRLSELVSGLNPLEEEKQYEEFLTIMNKKNPMLAGGEEQFYKEQDHSSQFHSDCLSYLAALEKVVRLDDAPRARAPSSGSSASSSAVASVEASPAPSASASAEASPSTSFTDSPAFYIRDDAVAFVAAPSIPIDQLITSVCDDFISKVTADRYPDEKQRDALKEELVDLKQDLIHRYKTSQEPKADSIAESKRGAKHLPEKSEIEHDFSELVKEFTNKPQRGYSI